MSVTLIVELLVSARTQSMQAMMACLKAGRLVSKGVKSKSLVEGVSFTLLPLGGVV